MNNTVFFGLSFNPSTLVEAAEQVITAANRRHKGLIVTPNVDHIVMLETDVEMRAIFKKALFCYPDGMPLVWLSKVCCDKPFPERVTGADLLPAVCNLAAERNIGVFFLGGNPGIAEQAAQSMQKIYPGLMVSGFYCPPFGFEHDEMESERIIENINSKHVDILFIGVGTPKQEKWANKYLEKLNVGPILCIGAALDFAAGTVKRSPQWIQRAGFEWLWRLLHDPRRLWRRYILRDSKFIYLAFREILRQKTHKRI